MKRKKPTLRVRFTQERNALRVAIADLARAEDCVWSKESRIAAAQAYVEKRRKIYERAKAEWEAAGKPMDTGYKPQKASPR